MQLISPSNPQARSAAPQETAPVVSGRHRPVVERIACWSARHRAVALIGWLVMVGGAMLAGQLSGTQSQPQYDPGQSGVAERMLTSLHVVTPPSESVLIQSRTPGPELHLRRRPATAARGPTAWSRALAALPATATDIRSPFGRDGKELIAPRGGGVLITFRVAGPHDSRRRDRACARCARSPRSRRSTRT